MSNFDLKYKRLNDAQKRAVDTIHGPVMVIAGPGTGKTELLSMRVANILRKTDSLPQNILCLTFTESGASAMRERLVDLIGKDAYHVAIHTFHSFGSEVINTYREFFYQGAQFHAAHELTTHEILARILKKLPHDSLLATQMNGEFTQLGNIQHSISDFKKAGLTPDDLQTLVAHNTSFIDFAEPYITHFFQGTINKKMLSMLPELYNTLSTYRPEAFPFVALPELSSVFLGELERVLDDTGSTKPLTAWRNKWFEKNADGYFVFKDRKRHKKLIEASHVYWNYLSAMQEASVYDYDDMILKTTLALELFPELRNQLQEKYQYILVDEFQDTNLAQLKIILSLIDNPVHEERPNILIVGDDDQAIYSFQGAEVSNIMTLQHRFKDPAIIPLVDNYRSDSQILEYAREVITQGNDRLETALVDLDKTPVPHASHSDASVGLHEALSSEEEYTWIAHDIQASIKSGVKAGDIAVLARNHRDIHALMPYLSHLGIAFEYEYRDNILDQEPVQSLLAIAEVVNDLASADVESVNHALPHLLAQPMWNISPRALWQLSLAAHTARTPWLETMQQDEHPSLRPIAQWLITLAAQSHTITLDALLDAMIGNEPVMLGKGTFTSPLKMQYFSEAALERQSDEFLRYLESLRYLRTAVKEYAAGREPNLSDLIEFTTLSRQARVNLSTPRSTLTHDASHVQLMTAHKSKGLEFDTVYILNATDSTWGSKSRSYSSRLSYPENLPIAPAGESEDEKLRLFFVAMTRAKRRLVLSYATQGVTHKKELKAHFLETGAWQPTAVNVSNATIASTRSLSWHEQFTPQGETLERALKPLLSTYRLSATHLNAFVDVSQGGPRYFLLHNLLHFPQAMPPAAAYGSAVHTVLKIAQEHYTTHGKKRPLEDLLYDFEHSLKSQHLSKEDFKKQLQKGTDHLSVFLPHFHETISRDDKPERDFRTQDVRVGEARITGIIDSLHIDHDHKTIIVRDYKTGTPSSSWQGKSDYEKIKLHKYTQQLLFYKLLIENSRDFTGYSVERGEIVFVQPGVGGKLHTLEYSFEKEVVDTFTLLVQKIWQHIEASDFIDTSQYEKNRKGILAFEKYLLDS